MLFLNVYGYIHNHLLKCAKYRAYKPSPVALLSSLTLAYLCFLLLADEGLAQHQGLLWGFTASCAENLTPTSQCLTDAMEGLVLSSFNSA